MEIDTDSKFPYMALDSYSVAVSTPAPFTGGTGNTRGDKDGTKGTMKIFTVTGDVLVRIFGVVTTTLVGAGTLEVGVTGNTPGLIAQVADATSLAAGDIYYAATSTKVGATVLSDILGPYIITNGLDINEKSGTADITAGQIYYICLWRPLTPGSSVVGLSE
jgi:hypothetical protein